MITTANNILSKLGLVDYKNYDQSYQNTILENLKSIFENKIVSFFHQFKDENRITQYIEMREVIQDVEINEYKMERYISVKANDKWYLVSGDKYMTIYNYETKYFTWK